MDGNVIVGIKLGATSTGFRVQIPLKNQQKLRLVVNGNQLTSNFLLLLEGKAYSI